MIFALVLLPAIFVAAAAADKVDPVPLIWEDVDCRLGSKVILNQVSGTAQPGRLLAIIGPSGSGKTTLLNTLCGQVPRNEKMVLSGRLFAGTRPRRPDQKQAYVRQSDVFYSMLTVRETLMTAARLRLPRDMPAKAKEAYVEDLMARLGLSKVADVVVGDDKVRGISGGERKRLNIACELFGSPSLVFADEPTTGLDSFQAERVMATLKSLAQDHGHTVVCSIHQPRGSIFGMMDDLLVLSEGEVMYQGPADKAAAYFAQQGHAMPKQTNPAEFCIDLVSIDYSSKDTEAASRQRIKSLAQYYRRSNAAAAIAAIAEFDAESGKVGAGNGKAVALGSQRRRAPVLEQFRLLLVRSWRQINRSKFANMTRVTANLGSAVVFGCIFWKLGLGQTQIGDRVGLLQVAAINTAMSSIIKTLVSFPTERAIVQQERAQDTYGVGPYFASKLVAELPISALFPNIFGLVLYKMTGLNPSLPRLLNFLGITTIEAFASSALGLLVGAITPNEDSALAMGPALMTVAIIFSGFYINQANIPIAFRWIKQVSIIKWAFEGLCINELTGMKFICDTRARGPCIETGEQMLQRLSFDKATVGSASMGLTNVLAGCYALTYMALVRDKPKFQPLLDPNVAAVTREREAAAAAARKQKKAKALAATASAESGKGALPATAPKKVLTIRGGCILGSTGGSAAFLR